MSKVWREIKDVWWVIATVAAIAFAAGGWMADLWTAPATASEALDMASSNSRSIDQLHRTVRIYICSQDDISRQVYFRLDCKEFGGDFR